MVLVFEIFSISSNFSFRESFESRCRSNTFFERFCRGSLLLFESFLSLINIIIYAEWH